MTMGLSEETDDGAGAAANPVWLKMIINITIEQIARRMG
jgi:hypothetical protein